MDNITPEEALAQLEGLLKRGDTRLDSLKEVFTAQGTEDPTEEGSRELSQVVPEAGFVVKTKDVTGCKVFVNICGSASIPAPGNWPEGQVPPALLAAPKNLEDMQEYLRLPVGLGPARPDIDHSGAKCVTIDCMYNADILKQVDTNRRVKFLLIDLAFAWIMDKEQLTLDANYKLPKMRYKGKPTTQLVRLDKVSSTEDTSNSLRGPHSSTHNIQAEIASPGSTGSTPRAAGTQSATGKMPRIQAPPSGQRDDAAGVDKLGGASGRQRSGASSFSFEPVKAEKSQQAAIITGPNSARPENPGGSSIDYEIKYKGVPVHTIMLTLTGTATGILDQTDVEIRGDQLMATSNRHQPLTISLPFGVARKGAKGVLTQDGSLHIELLYSPLQDWLNAESQAVTTC